LKRIFREYWVEFIALVVVGMGILLVVEEFSLREVLALLFHNLVANLRGLAFQSATGLGTYLSNFSSKDFIGEVLLVAAVLFLLWRGRYHFVHSAYWQARNCPKCGSGLHRIHRTKWDRFLSRTFLPGARRYQCKNRACGWSGLRDRRETDRTGRHRRSPEEKLQDC
jgi:hypothetical protein